MSCPSDWLDTLLSCPPTTQGTSDATSGCSQRSSQIIVFRRRNSEKKGKAATGFRNCSKHNLSDRCLLKSEKPNSPFSLERMSRKNTQISLRMASANTWILIQLLAERSPSAISNSLEFQSQRNLGLARIVRAGDQIRAARIICWANVRTRVFEVWMVQCVAVIEAKLQDLILTITCRQKWEVPLQRCIEPQPPWTDNNVLRAIATGIWSGS